MRSNRSVLLICITSLALASVVSGCGRKGALESPPSGAIEGVDDQGRPIKQEKRTVPDKPFILDGLI